MRWEALFADLEGQLSAADAADLDGEVRDRARREVARLRLADRGRSAVGTDLTVGLGAAGVAVGGLRRAGPDWWLLAGPGTAEQVVSLDAVTWVAGLPAGATDPESVSAVAARLGLGHVLRGVARDRASVTVVLRDGVSLTGTIDRVGADFLDLAEHAPEEARRTAAVRATRTVTFGGLAVVRAVRSG
jgi:hypothetical protein